MDFGIVVHPYQVISEFPAVGEAISESSASFTIRVGTVMNVLNEHYDITE